MKIALISGGELAERLARVLRPTDTVSIIDVRLRRQGFVLADQEHAASTLQHSDIIVNLLPTGQDFVNTGINSMIEDNCTIIDFSRPSIQAIYCCHSHKIIMGNRLNHPSLRIWPPLPAWQSNELPACSLPCTLASLGDLSSVKNDHDFAVIARYMGFTAKNPEGDKNA